MTDTNHTDSVEALVKELRTVADMINMGEKILWGRETTLMDKAADMLTTLHTSKDTNSPDSISTEKDRYQHTDRSNLGQIEKKLDLSPVETEHTDSVEATIEEVAQTIKIIACKAGSHGRTWKEADKMIRYELSKLVQAQTSQQVEYNAGFRAGYEECLKNETQQVEEAVKAERLKVISEIEAEVNTLFVFGRQVGIGGLYTTAAMRGPNEEVASWVKKEDVLVCIDKAKPLSTPNHQD